MTSVSKYVYIDKLNVIVNKYNNTYHRTIKMKPLHAKWSTYSDSSKEINNNNPKFKIADIVGASKYKNICAKVYTSNWSEEVFGIQKVKNTVPWTFERRRNRDIPADSNETNVTCKTQNLYIFLNVWLIVIALLTAVSSYCYLLKYCAKQKHFLPFHDTNNKLKPVLYW